MSLIDQIENPLSPLARYFSKHFPAAAAFSAEASADLTALPTTRPGPGAPVERLAKALIYRIRFHLASPPSRVLPAWMWALRLGLSPGIQDTGPFEEFFDRLDLFVDRIEPEGRRLELRNEERLARFCLVLARIEGLGRQQASRGRAPDRARALLDDLRSGAALTGLDPADIDDVQALSRGFHAARYQFAQDAVDLAPVFEGDAAAGAEEDDFLVGRRLVAVHSTVSPGLPPAWVGRLVLRALLDFDDARRVDAVAVYLARQGTLLSWRLDRLLERLSAGGAPPAAALRAELGRLLARQGRGRRVSRLFRKRARPRPSPHPDQLRLRFTA